MFLSVRWGFHLFKDICKVCLRSASISFYSSHVMHLQNGESMQYTIYVCLSVGVVMKVYKIMCYENML